MLVQFMVKNVLSFKEETILDMTAINAYKEHESNLIDNGTKKNFFSSGYLWSQCKRKIKFVYGNVLFPKIITKSLNNVDDDSMTTIERYYEPFKFEEKWRIQNSRLF